MVRVKDKKDLFQILDVHKKDILKYGVKKIGVFGSFVKNEQSDDSDVDFLVEFMDGEKTYKNFIRLAYFLEDILGRKIELLTKQSMSPYIGPKIIKEVEYVIAA